MSAPAYPRNAADYASLLASLLPTGAAWSVPDNGALASLLRAFADEFVRIDARALDLVEEADPRTALELLPDWESLAGLPDICSGQPDSARERQAAVTQKLTAAGGQNAAHYTDVAAALGYVVEIVEHRPARVGLPCDVPCEDEGWAFTWDVAVQPAEGWREPSTPPSASPGVALAAAEIGAPVGIRLRGWGAVDLECVISRMRPAHTNVLFTYRIEPAAAVWFDFTI